MTRNTIIEFRFQARPHSADPAAKPISEIHKACLERGLYPFIHWNVFAITPPLNITREELDEGLEILDDVLTLADEHYTA